MARGAMRCNSTGGGGGRMAGGGEDGAGWGVCQVAPPSLNDVARQPALLTTQTPA